jgi:hypothetical protein
MVLLMGDWTLFMDRQKVTLNLSNINNTGLFNCGFVHENVIFRGEGYWNDVAKRIYFAASEDVSPPPASSALNFTFEGYLVEDVPSNEPGADKLWTLVGTYHVSGVGDLHLPFALERAGWTDFPRRQYFGWYANKIEHVQ